MQQGKVLKTVLIILVAILVMGGVFLGGIAVGNNLPTGMVQAAMRGQNPTAQTTEVVTDVCTGYASASTPADLKTLFAPFWESWQLLHENYVDQPLDDVTLMRGAISGMLAATGDKHTSYMDPTEFKQANTSMEGEYEGIGAWVDTTGEYLKIIAPMKGSPAEAAGLKANDIVVAVNGEDQAGIPGELVLQKILGPAGEPVTLTVHRGEETLEFTIVRAKINVPVVDYRMLDNDIAYVGLTTFSDQATAQLRAALDDLMAQNPKGLILDLRNNGGGYLSTAIEVASEFIPEGVIMYEQYGDGTKEVYTAQPGGRATEIPMVVLVNEGTASASEIVAGAIQDHGRGKLVGTQTYGKGSVQNWITLSGDNGGVRITIARWLTPNEKQINDVGLTPDVVVEIDEYANYTQVPADGDTTNVEWHDAQLEAAIQLLLDQ